MPSNKSDTYKIILIITGLAVLIMGIVLLFIPPALFPDPGQGFEVLRSMRMGSGFNNFVSPDQSDISQNYTEFFTWWSPGQYLIPYFFKLITAANMGQATALTVLLAQLCGLAGFYSFFKKAGFTPLVSALSIVFIACQLAFVVPFVYYNGGEVLLFAFEGWFLYGCASIQKPGLKLILFVILSGWLGFFLKSSFVWMYAAGLCCLWVRLSTHKPGLTWIKEALWIGIPAALSLAVIYLFYISKGASPASTGHGIRLTSATFSFPLASPILSGFSIDDFVHGLIYHTGTPLFNAHWSITVLLIIAFLSACLVLAVMLRNHNHDYKLFLSIFYLAALLFFGISYLLQLNISYEARHFRILGILITPGLIYMVSSWRPAPKWAAIVIFLTIAYGSYSYLVKGYYINSRAAHGTSGFAQVNIDQHSLDKVEQLDKENKNATFVFIGDDLGLEITHNRVITMQPISDDLKIAIDDYRYDGFAGQLYIVLPESYNGPKEKMVMKSFPGYAGWNESMLSNGYVLYTADLKRK